MGTILARLSVLLAVAFLVFPSPALAVGDCDCFCTSAHGAVGGASLRLTPEACAAECKKRNERVIVCAYTAEKYPAQLPNCFDDARCKAQQGKLDKFQPPECPSGMHYCYPAGDKPIPISIKIGAITEVTDIGDFIDKMYGFLLGIAITIAIVMGMIGGLQYVLASGSGAVDAAKERIRNSVVGLVLLLGAYMVLYTVNPELVRLQAPRLPMVKRIAYVKNVGCAELEKQGYKIEDASFGTVGAKFCGSTAKVTADPKGTPPAAGTTCEYDTCPKQGDQCVGEGKKARCVSCKSVTPSNTLGIVPTSEICQSLTPPTTMRADGTVDVKSYCFSTSDPELLTSVRNAGAAVGATANTDTCALIEFNCQSINTCSDYDDVKAVSGDDNEELDDLNPDKTDLDLQGICVQDPCGAAKKSGTKRCLYKNDWPTVDCYST